MYISRGRNKPIAEVAAGSKSYQRVHNCAQSLKHVHTFIENQQLAPPHDSPSESQDLPLPHRQVRTSSCDLCVERDARLVVLVLQIEQPGGAQGAVEDGVIVLRERVEVLAKGAAEKLWLHM